jgi:hypothetical protein
MILIATEPVPVHPLLSVAVRVYVTVDGAVKPDVDKVGYKLVVELNPVPGDQEYV